MTDLLAVLAQAQEKSFIGPGSLVDQIEHAQRFATAGLNEADIRLALDLGSGGGLPGLVLAQMWEKSEWVLLDSQSRRITFLEKAARDLAMAARIRAMHGRAEERAHDPGLRATFDLVVARSFGAPAIVAECASGFLRVGGSLLVSEPPNSTGARWEHPDALDMLGLERLGRPSNGIQVLRQAALCPTQYPRRPGTPAKRPLF